MKTVVVVEGDLTRQQVDAIVNAANDHLAHGGGVAAAIARAAGSRLQSDSDAWVAARGPLGPGEAAVTPGHDLPAAHVIHVVGPRYRHGQDNAALLGQAVIAALDAAAEVGARTVALPAISAGIFGYPAAEAAAVIATAVSDWLTDQPGILNEVRLVAIDNDMARHFTAGLHSGGQ